MQSKQHYISPFFSNKKKNDFACDVLRVVFANEGQLLYFFICRDMNTSLQGQSSGVYAVIHLTTKVRPERIEDPVIKFLLKCHHKVKKKKEKYNETYTYTWMNHSQ